MANSSDTRKLELRSELVRHLKTADKMAEDGVPSSDGKAAAIQYDIRLLDRGNEQWAQQRVKHWDMVLSTSNKSN